MKLGFVGGGIMAEALITGIKDAELDAEITVGEPVATRREALAEVGITAVADNIEAINGADIVALAIKPQQLDPVAASLKGRIGAEQTVLSILAGVKMRSIGLKLNHKRLIRVMPNTPAQISQGMSVWTASSEVPDAVREFVGKALGSFGEEVFVQEEKYVDMATAVSASGPAYIFRMIDAMIEGGVLLGMPADLARKLVIQTVLGSATLTRESGKHPGELAAMVTTPGGTTAAALMALEEGKFKATVMSAVKAAYDRGEELGGGK